MKEGFPKNSLISHYRIVNKIGEGGMGAVYLARDTKLERKVALKVLPDDVAADAERLRRFGQEARAVSALNHPNILTIYEIGEVDGTNYISTEFVDGDNLRDVLHSKGMPLHRSLDIAIQTASALAAAHEAGITHRDIKPENIMVRRDGLVKVLDFGLAKLTETTGPSIDPEGETRAQVKTAPGVIMGTVQYMSPEQTRGKPTDSRSDIWSLGCVIYEMAAGHAPFSGETAADIIAEIVKMNPGPLGRIVPQLPERLDEIISKALEKSPDERYQTVKDLLIDLKRLKKKLESDFDTERSHAPDDTGGSALAKGARTEAFRSSTAQTEAAAIATISGKQFLTSSIRQHKFGASAIAAILLLAFVGLGYTIYTIVRPKKMPQVQGVMKINRLTSDGLAGATSISPDGKYVVHSQGNNESRGLWVRQTATNSAVQIVPNAAGRFTGTTFSEDGNYIYYTWQDNDQHVQGTLFEIPTLGGTPRRLLSNIGGAVTLSPDGKQLAFSRGNAFLVVANIDGSSERVLHAVDNATEWLASDGPSWSPDGKMIAIGKGSSADKLEMYVAAVPVDERPTTQVTEQRWRGEVERVIWLRDGSGLIVSASNGLSIGTQIWYLPYPEGNARRITNDLLGYGTFSLGVTADGSTIVTVQEDVTRQIWTAAAGDDEGRAKRVTTGKYDGGGMAWTPDGKIVFVRKVGESPDIWIMNADGTDQRQLTKDRYFDDVPQVTPDGRYIVFVSDRSGLPHIWRVNIDGTEPIAITSGDTFDDETPRVTPDSKWVVYNSWRTGKFTPWKVSISGGEPIQLYGSTTAVGAVTPDGKAFIADFLDETVKPVRHKPVLMPIAGGPPLKVFEGISAPQNFVYEGTGWAPGGRELFYTPDRNVWSLPMTGGQPKPVTDFKSEVNFYLAVSPDGKRFALSRGTVSNDVVLIRDFR
jgi:eukaryotic-like serine/threonine-protein kinase